MIKLQFGPLCPTTFQKMEMTVSENDQGEAGWQRENRVQKCVKERKLERSSV